MAEQAIEEQDSLNPVEEEVQETETVSAEDLAEKNKQLFERAKKAEAKVKELEKKPETLKTNSSDSEERFERLELKTEGYKSDEIDFLMQNGGQKALENPIVMAGIEGMRAKVKSKDASVSGTGKSYTYQKYGERDLKKMTAEDLEKIIPQD